MAKGTETREALRFQTDAEDLRKNLSFVRSSAGSHENCTYVSTNSISIIGCWRSCRLRVPYKNRLHILTITTNQHFSVINLDAGVYKTS